MTQCSRALSLLLLAILTAVAGINAAGQWRVGRALFDITGPVAGVEMSGYAMLMQIAQGVHMRMYSRAFVFEADGKRAVFCSLDTSMLSSNIKDGVIEMLQAEYGPDLYTHRNVILSSTHSHAATGGFQDYLLYSITSLGHVKASAQAIITGTFRSIVAAHNDLQTASLSLSTGKLFNSSINRSPTAYAANPADERALYADEGNTDKLMTVLAITKTDDLDAITGMISWFPVHALSMNNTNRLISGDNKGYASFLMEQEMGGGHKVTAHNDGAEPAKFVAAFAQANEGDSSPNTEGAFCLNSGLPCNRHHSICLDPATGTYRSDLCHGRGPGWQQGDEESTRIIGLRQYVKARQLLRTDSKTLLSAEVQVAHAWIDISNTTVTLGNGSLTTTCLPARGYAFAAGTSDGPAIGDFIQGYNGTQNPFWSVVSSLLSKPSEHQKACHHPKPILLNTGEMTVPYMWEPRIVDIQLMRLGSLLIAAVPAEFTAMAGRRLRRSIKKIFSDTVPNVHVVIAGLSNMYSGYVTTPEEYRVQRYEGASTLYGPNTLRAYIQEFQRLAYDMVRDLGDTTPRPRLPRAGHPAGVKPAKVTDNLWSLLPPIAFDAVPPGRMFGGVVPGKDVRGEYVVGDTARATFYSGHPRVMAQVALEHLTTQFMQVEKYVGPSMDELRDIARQLLPAGFNCDSVLVKPTNHSRSLDFWFRATSSSANPLFVVQSTEEAQPMTTESDLVIQHSFSQSLWQVVVDDNDWNTKFKWSKPLTLLSPFSYAELEWRIAAQPTDIELMQRVMEIPTATEMASSIQGAYRFVHHGAYKSLLGQRTLYTGHSSVFHVSTGSLSTTDKKPTSSDNVLETLHL